MCSRVLEVDVETVIQTFIINIYLLLSGSNYIVAVIYLGPKHTSTAKLGVAYIPITPSIVRARSLDVPLSRPPAVPIDLPVACVTRTAIGGGGVS